eukprot:m.599275 g.599275  ORF g.599275 m.599275 type:complete len:140 (-) comp58078_c0_seq1:88-507(-)
MPVSPTSTSRRNAAGPSARRACPASSACNHVSYLSAILARVPIHFFQVSQSSFVCVDRRLFRLFRLFYSFCPVPVFCIVFQCSLLVFSCFVCDTLLHPLRAAPIALCGRPSLPRLFTPAPPYLLPRRCSALLLLPGLPC